MSRPQAEDSDYYRNLNLALSGLEVDDDRDTANADEAVAVILAAVSKCIAFSATADTDDWDRGTSSSDENVGGDDDAQCLEDRSEDGVTGLAAVVTALDRASGALRSGCPSALRESGGGRKGCGESQRGEDGFGEVHVWCVRVDEERLGVCVTENLGCSVKAERCS